MEGETMLQALLEEEKGDERKLQVLVKALSCVKMPERICETRFVPSYQYHTPEILRKEVHKEKHITFVVDDDYDYCDVNSNDDDSNNDGEGHYFHHHHHQQQQQEREEGEEKAHRTDENMDSGDVADDSDALEGGFQLASLCSSAAYARDAPVKTPFSEAGHFSSLDPPLALGTSSDILPSVTPAIPGQERAKKRKGRKGTK